MNGELMPGRPFCANLTHLGGPTKEQSITCPKGRTISRYDNQYLPASPLAGITLHNACAALEHKLVLMFSKPLALLHTGPQTGSSFIPVSTAPLSRLGRLLGDSWIRKALINPESDAFKPAHQTTWEDLRSQHLIQDAEGGQIIFTGEGWEAGLRATGKDDPDTLVRVERIYRAIRTAVAGRSNPEGGSPVRLSEVANQAGLQSVFVANVIEARLIESWLNRRGATWAPEWEGRMILVPPDFGAEIL